MCQSTEICHGLLTKYDEIQEIGILAELRVYELRQRQYPLKTLCPPHCNARISEGSSFETPTFRVRSSSSTTYEKREDL